MKTFGPVHDLFTSREDRLRLLDAHKIKLARLDVFQQHEKAFQNSVMVAKQSLQEEQASRLAQDKNSSEVTERTLASSSQKPATGPTAAAHTATLETHAASPSQISTSANPATIEGTSQTLSGTKLEERLKTVATQNEAQKEERKLLATEEPAKSSPAKESPSLLANTLDVLNPLQHIPFVNLVYREVSGDTISSGSKVAGGVLFGGLLGGVSSLSALAGAGIGGATGAADASFTQASGMETSKAVARLYNGEPFTGDSEKTTATAQQLGPSSSSIRDESITFDARHMYSDVLKKFGTDIDILLAQSPDNYGAEIVYAHTIAHIDSMSSKSIQARLPQEADPDNRQNVLARLHTPANQTATAVTTKNDAELNAPLSANPSNSILSKAQPLEIKKDALDRLAVVREQIEENNARNQPLDLAPEINAVSDIASMIEKRLSKLIELRNSPNAATSEKPLPPSTSSVSVNASEASETLPAASASTTASYTPENLAASVQPGQQAQSIESDDLSLKMQERLNAFQQRQEQRIFSEASESIVNVPPAQNPDGGANPLRNDGVSQAPATPMEELSPRNDALASAMRDAFSRFRDDTPLAQK